MLKQFRQQVTSGQVLQPFVMMSDITGQHDLLQKEIFILCNMPHSQFSNFVDILLINQRHIESENWKVKTEKYIFTNKRINN